ncbi:MAG: replicative DNA helicase, partial [Candidatus Omnitrophica bacterium]|nr:replicative DNA helicase [Candidatus Omnitrophota bacterium]
MPLIADVIEKVPPHNIEAEIATLGSMLMGEDAISKAIEFLDESCFYKGSHRKIFASIINLYNKSNAVDIVTLIEDLKKTGNLEEVGGPAYVTSVVNAVPTSANVLHYAKIVKEKSVLRHLITNATQIVQESFEPDSNVDELLDRAERLIFDIASKKFESNITHIKEIIKDSIEKIDALYQRKENLSGLATGFHDFDVLTAGLQNSDLIVIAG